MALLFALPATALSQGEISGRVVAADSARPGIQGTEVSIAKLGRSARSDSSGRYRLKDVPPGEHVVLLRAIGFRSESSKVYVNNDEVVSFDVVLTRTTTVLPERVVEAAGAPPPAKLVEFMERSTSGIGRFITRDQLAKAEGGLRQTGDVISMVPGVVAKRGSNKIWIAGRANVNGCVQDRKAPPITDPKCQVVINYADFITGARPACFMDVYLDGALVFNAKQAEAGLFDINTILPEHIAGIEVYTSAAQVPAKYNRTGTNCGVLLVWTR
jgi:hypothetical protein